MVFGNGTIVIGIEGHAKPVSNIMGESPTRLQAPHVSSKSGIRSRVGMQFDTTSGPPRFIQTKRRACANFDVAHTSYFSVIWGLITSVVTKWQLQTYGPVLRVAYTPAPQALDRPDCVFRTVFELIPL